MSSLNGFIKLHRKLVAWGWYQDYVVKDVFLHLLLTANFKTMIWRKIELAEGQLVIGTQKLADELGFSRQQIRTALKKLESTGEIRIESTNKYSIVTIVNWRDYQSDNPKSSTSRSREQTVNKKFFSKNSTSKSTNTSTNKKNPKTASKPCAIDESRNDSTNTSTKTLTNNQPTNNQQITNKQPQRKNNKNIKNDKNDKNSLRAHAREDGDGIYLDPEIWGESLKIMRGEK